MQRLSLGDSLELAAPDVASEEESSSSDGSHSSDCERMNTTQFVEQAIAEYTLSRKVGQLRGKLIKHLQGKGPSLDQDEMMQLDQVLPQIPRSRAADPTEDRLVKTTTDEKLKHRALVRRFRQIISVASPQASRFRARKLRVSSAVPKAAPRLPLPKVATATKALGATPPTCPTASMASLVSLASVQTAEQTTSQASLATVPSLDDLARQLLKGACVAQS